MPPTGRNQTGKRGNPPTAGGPPKVPSFGIGCEREHSLKESGQEFDVTRERIRQIETKALRQLRAAERAGRLRTLMPTR